MINIKSKEEVAKMSRSGKIAAFVLKEVARNVKPGISTFELDKIASRIIYSRGATPSFLNYNGYPAATCISINEEIVHGLPSIRKISANDLVKIDVGVELDGFHSDTATSVFVGRPDKEIVRLITGVKAALTETIKIAKPGLTIGDLEKKTGDVLRLYGLSPVLTLSGHGIGRNIHEEPSIKSDGNATTGATLKEGMVLAIEPMATLGSGRVRTGKDGWTIVSSDTSMTAHFEHTVAITKAGSKILTQ
jgi:methionyl aminopeptidase